MSETLPQDAPEAPEIEEVVPPTETTETPKEPDDKEDPAAKRIGRLTARLAAKDAEVRAIQERLARFEQQTQRQAEPVDTEVERIANERAERLYQERVVKERVNSFHEAGKAAYSDWQDRCAALIEMGGDKQFAELLIDMPDGAKIAAALADDPEAMERIAGIKTERGRAIALGKFSAAMEHKPEPVRAPPVSRAPAPIRPVTGAAKVQFNEYSANTTQLVDYYSKQALAKRGL